MPRCIADPPDSVNDVEFDRLAPGRWSGGYDGITMFAIDPSGTWLLASNQDTNTIVTFRINHQTGHLHPTGHKNPNPQPRLHQASAGGRDSSQSASLTI